jgi:lipoprotein-releasing system permease protein
MFELSVAFKYLLPRWRQLSVSVIAFISVLVISLVVWLVVVFLSVTHGIEHRWLDTLVAINAPVRLVPTEAYYDSYYYQVDAHSAASQYTHKTIHDKLETLQIDPYDTNIDPELPVDMPLPDLDDEGHLKDPVKKAYSAIQGLSARYSHLHAHDFEVAVANLRLRLVRSDSQGELQSFLSQASYVVSYDDTNNRIAQTVQPFTAEDLTNQLNLLSLSDTNAKEEAPEDERLLSPEAFQTQLKSFLSHLQISHLQPGAKGWVIPEQIYPAQGEIQGLAVLNGSWLRYVIIDKDPLKTKELLQSQGIHVTLGTVRFHEGQASFTAEGIQAGIQAQQSPVLMIESGMLLPVQLDTSSTAQVDNVNLLRFHTSFNVQGLTFTGPILYKGLEIGKAIANQVTFPEADETEQRHGILLPITFRENKVLLGDRGFISYYSASPSSLQEQRIPVYVAGFYDPGLTPIGSRMIFADQAVTTQIRSSVAHADQLEGNGINVWFDDIKQSQAVKAELCRALDKAGIGHYWRVETYEEYEFARPLIQQFHSDRTLFSLIALIIIIVACSNIISMLILLVNDKRREIGILQSMGASSRSIALIFATCGTVMGMIGSVIGIGVAIFTLHHLDILVQTLSAIQGHDAFQVAFYGATLPNELSSNALVFVSSATVVISLLAGVIPAIKATMIRPTSILRSE